MNRLVTSPKIPLRVLVLKASAVLFCTGLLLARFRITGGTYFSFMLWNLFLAALPLGFAILLPRRRAWSRSLPVLALWLLFFPNAPYVLTDMIHLRQRTGVPLWFDLVLLLSFALTALWLGFASLRLVQSWVMQHFSVGWSWVLVAVVMPLTGFGIYIGRFWRWNSWDILTQPAALGRSLLQPVLMPRDYSEVWLFTLVSAFSLALAYLAWIFATPAAKEID